ncbi:hypothetical protein NYF23_12870 [SAR92 clade bacterium H455]|uniref:Uncharacterized protein n=1 Tax=SAR92 clade bacterium H455 TaxID=2974818 RepID=A0ABY5TNF7_9GAMM|nr:hypothetical protein NYF23_12870 [SAR92 clade bacterium H455]
MKTTTTVGQIKTPKTVNEFRQNLKRYFYGCGKNALYVKPENGVARAIPIASISSLNDIYRLTGSGFGGDGSSPCIIPLINFDMDEVADYMDANELYFNAWGFFGDEYKVYNKEKSSKVQRKVKNPQWFSLDNQILREFYVKVLGEFAGYSVLEQEVA